MHTEPRARVAPAAVTPSSPGPVAPPSRNASAGAIPSRSNSNATSEPTTPTAPSTRSYSGGWGAAPADREAEDRHRGGRGGFAGGSDRGGRGWDNFHAGPPGPVGPRPGGSSRGRYGFASSGARGWSTDDSARGGVDHASDAQSIGGATGTRYTRRELLQLYRRPAAVPADLANAPVATAEPLPPVDAFPLSDVEEVRTSLHPRVHVRVCMLGLPGVWCGVNR